jgi:uncharacterized protein (DUF433 family)
LCRFGREVCGDVVILRPPRLSGRLFEAGRWRFENLLELLAGRGMLLPMIDWSTCSAVEQHAGRLSGAWVFCGTRVPVSALFENLEDGATVEQFVEWFPGVTAEQVRAVLAHAGQSLRVA